jgi:drug/metabolite transporter (DMT)-like permease
MMMVYLKLLLTAFFWGGTFIAGRAIAGSVAPFSAAFVRFTVASIFLAVFAYRFEGRLPALRRQHILALICLGMTGVLAYNVFFFRGLQHIEAGRAAVIIANNPILIAAFSALIFKERLRWFNICGILLSVLGAIIVISKGQLSAIWAGGFGWGELLIFGCVLSWVTFSLIGKVLMAELSPLTCIFYASVIGTGALILPASLEGIWQDFSGYRGLDWFSLFYLGFFGTALGFVWYYQGIKRIGPTKAGLFINFVPISAIVLAFFILSEPLTPSLFVGTFLVCAGVFLTNLKFQVSVLQQSTHSSR